MIGKIKFSIDEQGLRKFAITAFTALIGILVGWGLWRYYMLSPWTRDGRVRAETVTVAAEVFGKVSDLKVVENQLVHKGDILFIIDPQEYQLNLAKAEATLETRRQQLLIQQEIAERRNNLSAESISKEEQQVSESSVVIADSAFEEARAQRDLAKLNLDRTIVRSPVNGYVDNLRLRVGDYATVGQNKLTIIDSDSFWVSGYFEETKLPRIHAGNKAIIKLMGVDQTILGHIESVSKGIADSNGSTDVQGLTNVNPVFYWVRLAQRIPVRIHIDQVPDGVILVAGMTCTVVVKPKMK